MINVTGASFVRNAFRAGFPLFEAMASVLSITDQFCLLDLGSDDGTYETCMDIAKKNKRLTVFRERWSNPNDSSAFADATNRIIDLCPTEAVLIHQADEIFHENLLAEFKRCYDNKQYALTVERIQLGCNFSQVRWLPHMLCRSVIKGRYKFRDDGMNVADSSGCYYTCPYPNIPGHELSNKPSTGRAFPWHEPEPGRFFDGRQPKALNEVMARVFPWRWFLYDTSACFRDNQADKAQLHAPFWRANPNLIDNMPRDRWLANAIGDPAWTALTSPFPLPKILYGLVGMTRYRLRDEIRSALENDDYSGVM